ncbi:Uncharacterised protein [Mycobacteroides abscessus subsp. abscessus]|uniref:hypothetical protein n=1 Tax=Mycobacteroides abscessus TaxID=36809 RepID=UPI0002684139|nr:hypothetical protein MA3A0119R_0473 [Mycobacteroides abscessus 3A-0119-R]EIV39323.1 hypothetical protein MA3A0122R_0538 [Mycobacteroides abscessus 3A-0122-R]EIV40496.1 hypothetical protein MA3A0731_1141 [Mycobacteroides abscessus 3A-0731]EIV53239.1 hypothetical protein MA3A0930S_2312 [Mycobacteroides abscessus 3A-0930-S]EIV58714.1 hypothetical protein MA3A0930R_0487 [Mycobacteroides abscessus 3A-0930-R]CPS05513.1 Uncharacterised protein [Mycobacteroides abscessus]SHS40042.1 Uncharacterised
MGDNRMSENTTLPVHPITGLQAIGFTRRGPVWPIMGASEPAGGTETEPKSEQDTDKLPDDHPLVKTLAANKIEIKELKAKAARLDEIEEAQKTQAQKDADRITKAEAEAATVPSRVANALKEHLVAFHKIDAEDAELFLTGDDPELLLKQVARFLEQTDKQSKSNRVPGEGTNGRVKPSTMQQFFDELTGRSS